MATRPLDSDVIRRSGGATLADLVEAVEDAQGHASAASAAAATATTQAGIATTQAGIATTGAATATTQAGIATTQAGIATTKAAEASTHKDAAYGYAQSAASAVAYQNLAAISASKVATAVDLFVYDTSRDSDGGAWRKRCQHTSWFNEALNTATRGARREFPAVALLMIEQFRLTIFDADDPALPMWMIFDPVTTTAPQIWRTGRSAKAVAAVNGVIAFALSAGGPDSSSGLIEMDFLADRMTRTTEGAALGFERIGNRSVGGLLGVVSLTRIIPSTAVNDVAMTVLPDAPVNPSTGLPVPTIAVASLGGVAVMNDNGVIFSDSAIAARNVRFDPDGVLFWMSDNYNLQSFYAVPTTYRNGVGVGTQWGVGASANYSTTFPLIGGGSLTNQLVSTGRRALAAGGITASAHTKPGLARYLLNTTAIGRSMVALITSTYSSGWLVGDTRGAWLASKDAANLVSANAWTAGLVDTGWTTDGCAVAASGGNLDFTFSAANKYAYKAFNTVVGQSYVIEASMTGIARNVSVSTSGVNGNPLFAAAAGNTFVRTFVATQATHYFGVAAASGAGTTTLSSLSIRVASADRSIKGNGLKVNGTIARAAVASGAELVGFSGFSASNYLEQPYNSDLDFGTGDFCFGPVWMKSTDVNDCLIERGNYTGSAYSGARQLLYVRGDGKPEFVVEGATGGSDTLTAANAINDGSWHLVMGVRRGSQLELWVDGDLAVADTSINASGGFNNGSAIVRSGLRLDGLNPNGGSMALLRMGATAPSADQIRKIYEDERALFQPSAACTLYGASDAVTALAHDTDTGLLHAGTSAGRSVFQGLRRVANTANAVEAAIAAANGLVVDE